MFCWCFRNTKQPPFGCITTRKPLVKIGDIYLPYQLVTAGFLNHQQYLLWISESKTSKRSKTMFQLQVMLTASFHLVGSKLRLQRKERSWLGRNAGWGTNPIRFQKFLLPQHKASKAMCGSIGSNLSCGSWMRKETANRKCGHSCLVNSIIVSTVSFVVYLLRDSSHQQAFFNWIESQIRWCESLPADKRRRINTLSGIYSSLLKLHYLYFLFGKGWISSQLLAIWTKFDPHVW